MDKFKICGSCKIEKPFSDFTKHKKYKDGLNSICKKCACLKVNEYRAKNKDYEIKRKENNWKRLGIKNLDGSVFKWKDYLNLVSLAGNKCMLCGLENSNGDALCVDHNHKTGLVRFLLCHPCNTALGLLKDNPYLLQKAADMILKHDKIS